MNKLYYIVLFFNIWLFKKSYSQGVNHRPRDVGAPCEWEGVKGNCIDFWTCSTNAIDSLQGKYPPVCSTDGNEVLACCTSCWVEANISTTVYIENHIFGKTGQKSNDKCLDYLKMYKKQYMCYHTAYGVGKALKHYNEEEKCFHLGLEGAYASGGEDAKRAEYPHMALLGYGEDQESAQWHCGGSVISEWYILTAGHCRSNQIFRGEVQFVALGILKRSDPPSLWQVYRVDTFIPHPEYRPPSKYHDIALIRTDKRIEFSHAVLPACLMLVGGPQNDGFTKDHTKTAYATGWGRLGHRQSLADVLQKVEVTRFTSEQCSEQYGPHRHLEQGFHNLTQMCYGDSDVGRDTCEGDSGGPLQIDKPLICPQIIIGVTSSGHPCGFAGSSGLYTRVEYYRPWIEGIVWP